jgi:hypothetical protein
MKGKGWHGERKRHREVARKGARTRRRKEKMKAWIGYSPYDEYMWAYDENGNKLVELFGSYRGRLTSDKQNIKKWLKKNHYVYVGYVIHR